MRYRRVFTFAGWSVPMRRLSVSFTLALAISGIHLVAVGCSKTEEAPPVAPAPAPAPVAQAADHGDDHDHDHAHEPDVRTGPAEDLPPPRPVRTVISPAVAPAAAGKTDEVKRLLDEGADVNGTDARGLTILHVAVERADAALVNLAIDKGAKLDAVSDGNKEVGDKKHEWTEWSSTPLLLAVERGDAKLTKLLLEKGASPDALNGRRQSALAFASERGDLEMVKLLVDKGANVDGPDFSAAVEVGPRPLTSALAAGKNDVAKLLLDKGADPNRTGKVKRLKSPLTAAIEAKEPSLEMAKLLLDKGANPNGIDGEFRAPLHGATAEGLIDFVKLLVDRGVSPELATRFRSTPLMIAARTGHPELVRYFLSKGADPTKLDSRSADAVAHGLAAQKDKRPGAEEVLSILAEDQRTKGWKRKSP